MNLKSVPKQKLMPTLEQLCQIVKQAAEFFVSMQQEYIQTTVKSDGGYVTQVDEAIQAFLKEALMQRWPQYEFIGEEMEFQDQAKVFDHDSAGYWVLDPLDGTTNFAHGFKFYGISLALVIHGETQLGVIYDPVHLECYCAERGNGAYLNGKKLQTTQSMPLSLSLANVDFKRLTSDLALHLVKSPPYRSQRNLGSSVLEWCWLAADRVHVYVHGGQKLWDFAAGYLILREAGGAATSLSGSPLDCTKLRKRAVAAASNQALLDQWMFWIRENSDTFPKINYED